jgi:large repetitive protein
MCVALAGFGIQPVAMADARAVAAAVVTSKASAPVADRPDAVSAMLTAKVQGHRVEDLSQRTETTQVFANPDGSWTSQEAATPVRARDTHGNWADIDATLKPVPGGYAPTSATDDLVISGGGGTTFATMTVGGNTLSWSWPSVLPAPTVEGDTATYASVIDGGDLVVTATSSGFRHDVVLRHAPAGRLSFAIPVATGGPVMSKRADGGLTVKTKRGHQLLSAPRPVMYDSPDPVTGVPTHQVDVATSVTKTAAGAVVTLDPDQGFLADPSTVYPVVVDPVWNSTNPDDTWIYNTSPTAVHPGDSTLYVGTPNAGSTKYRTFVRFNGNTEPWNGASVSSATLTLRNLNSSGTTCSGTAVEVRRVAGDWDPGSLNWNNQPTTSTTYAATNTARKGGSTGCAAGDVSWNVTGIVQDMASWAANYGFRVAGSDETKTATYREYRAAGTYNPPFLTVTYNHTPATPTTPVVGGVSTYAPPGGMANNYVQTLRPTFTSTFSDPDVGDPVLVRFDVATSLGGAAVAICQYWGAMGQQSCTLGSDLTDDTTYYVSAVSFDGTAWTPYSGSTKFIVATQNPAAPVVSCPGYPDGSWTATAPGGSVTCTITAVGSGASAPGYIDVSVDRGTPTRVLIAQSTDANVAKTTVTVPTTDGGHGITATAVSPSGKLSDVTDYGFGFGAMGMMLPAAGPAEITTDTVAIDAAGPPSASGTGTPAVTVRWRVAGTNADFNTGWNDDTTSGLKVTNDATAGVHVTGAWDTRHAVTDNGSGTPVTLDPDRPYLLDIQVCVDYPGAQVGAHCTWPTAPRQVLRVAHAFGGAFPVTDVPGGQVALWTGELAIGDSDATVGSPGADLSISRTAASFAGPVLDPATKVFGPGWAASLDGPAAGLGDMTLVDNTLVDGTLQLVDGVGDVMIFGATDSPARRATGTLATGDWVALDEDTELSGTVLRAPATGNGNTVTVTEDDGTVTTYTAQTPPAQGVSGVFTVASINEAGTEGATTYSRDPAGRITRMLAPVPAGVTCPTADTAYTNAATVPAGCRALTITYATTTTATSSTPGDITGQVKAISQVVGGSTQPIPVLASYKYDSASRLVSVTDPRNNLTTAYTYDASSNRIASVTPAGLKPINYLYAPTSHKLARVTRERPATDPAGGTANLATIVYDVATSGDAGLPDLTVDTVGGWGQGSPPTHATAFFGPDQPLSGAGTSVSPGDVDAAGSDTWADADLTYTDDDGRATNTAEYGAGGWQYTSTSYDSHDNVIRALSERDIAAIKTGDLVASQAGQLIVYNTEAKDANGKVVLAAGSVVTDTYGTARWIRTQAGALGWVRPHTHTDYDQGAPNVGINLATGQRYALATTAIVNAVDGSADPSTAGVVETYSKTLTDYSDAVAGNTDAGWNMGLASKVTTDMTGSAGSTTTDITSRTYYDATGRVIEARQPKSDGTDAGTRETYYYTAGAHPVVAACGGKSTWAGALCRTTYAGSNPALVTTTITSYDDQLNPLTTEETAGGATRTTTSSYRIDGAPAGSTVTATGLAGSTPIGATSLDYDPGTGLPTTSTTAAAGGNPGGTITTGYDTWGRQVSYAQAAGEATTTSYDAAGNVAQVVDPQGTTTYTYDGTDAAGNHEHRGLPTKVAVTRPTGGAVEITGAYDAAGVLTVQKLPGGIAQRTTYDTAGEPVALTYSGTIGSDTDATWLAWSQNNDAVGRVRRDWTPDGAAFTGTTGSGAAATGFARDYTYDRAARLVEVTDQTMTAAGVGVANLDDPTALQAATVCQVRDYAFDANGNRSGLTRTTASPGQACPTAGGAGAVTSTWGYDAADQITTAPGGGSYSYDAFGRATTMPQTDTPAAAVPGATPGDVSLGYYDDDSVKSLTQNGTTTAFGLDPAGRRSTSTTTPATGDATTIERHYVDSSDNPGWTTTTTGTGAPAVERYVDDLGGDLGVTITDTAAGTDLAVSVVDLHGDQVSQIDVPASGPATGIEGWSDTDEYGNSLNPSTTGTTPSNTTGASGGLGYGWLGDKQRATDTTGLVLMGARVYNPCSGGFTSTDPVPGGNTTAYSYPQDPVSQADLDGNMLNPAFNGDSTGKPPPKKERHGTLGGIVHTVKKTAFKTIKTLASGTASVSVSGPFLTASVGVSFYDARPHVYSGNGVHISATHAFHIGVSGGYSLGHPSRHDFSAGLSGCLDVCVGAQNHMTGMGTHHGLSPYFGFGEGLSSSLMGGTEIRLSKRPHRRGTW